MQRRVLARPWRFFAPMLVALAPGLAWSQQPTPPTDPGGPPAEAAPPGVTLEQAIAYGRAHQPQTMASRARVQAARREAEVPAAQWRPSFGAFAELVGSTVNNSTATVINNPAVDLPRIGATPTRRDPNWMLYPTSLVALGVRQTILDFGRIQAQTAVAEATTRVEEARGQLVDQEIDWQIALSFYDVLASRASASVAARALDRSRARRAFVEAASGAGMRPATDRTRAEADEARFEAALARADGNLRLARMRLAAAMGESAPEVDAVEPAAGRPLEPVYGGSIDGVLEARDPSLRAMREAAAAQQATTRALATAARPFLSATGAISGRGGGAPPSSGQATLGVGFLPLVPNLDVGLILTVPLHDPTLAARVEASRAREEAMRHETDGVRLRQIAAARQSQQAARIADSALPALDRAARTAIVNAEQAEARFKAGLGTVTEVAEAEALRVEAELQVILGKFDARRARVALKRSLSDKEMAW